MPKGSNTKSGPDDFAVSGAPKGTFGGQLALHTYSDSTYYGHIFKVILAIAIVVGIGLFIVLGFFFPQCNSTQDRGFYSCSCKEGSALDVETGNCYCLDTASVLATNGCPNYVNNQLRYVMADERDPSAKFGGWKSSDEVSDLCA